MGRLLIVCAGFSIRHRPSNKIEEILLAAPTIGGGGPKGIDNYNRLIEIVHPSLFIEDSGGYQIFVAERDYKKFIKDMLFAANEAKSLEEVKRHLHEIAHKAKTINFNPSKPLIVTKTDINLAPVHVTQVANQLIKKPDIVIGLDFPIDTINDPYEQSVEYMRKVGFNILWTYEMADLMKRNCTDIKFYVPVQCYTLKQFEFFLKAISGIKFDGLSLPLRNMSLKNLLKFMIRFLRHDVKNLHILGTNEFYKIALSAYMAFHFFNLITIDSKSWNTSALFNSYLNPFNLSSEKIGDDVVINENTKNECNCPYCKGMSLKDIQNLDYTTRGKLVSRHNYWVSQDVAAKLYNHSRDALTLISYISKVSTKKEKIDELSTILHLVDMYKGADKKGLLELEYALKFV